MQKLCCRLITGVPKRTPSAPLFKMLNIVALDEMYKHSVMIIMYRFYKGMLPSVMNQIFSRKADARSHCTRQSHHINVPLCKSQVSFNSLKYQGPSIWNKCCTNVGYDCSLHTFSKRVRLCIFNVWSMRFIQMYMFIIPSSCNGWLFDLSNFSCYGVIACTNIGFYTIWYYSLWLSELLFIIFVWNWCGDAYISLMSCPLLP